MAAQLPDLDFRLVYIVIESPEVGGMDLVTAYDNDEAASEHMEASQFDFVQKLTQRVRSEVPAYVRDPFEGL